MTSSSTSSEGMDRPKSFLAKADAAFTCSEDTDADSVKVLPWFVVQAAIVGVGTCVLMTRFLCTLSLIFCSNKHGVHVGFGGEVGRGLVTSNISIANKGCNQIVTGTKTAVFH